MDLDFKNTRRMATETLFWRVMNDLLTIGIVGGFVLLIYSKFKRITMKEAMEEIKDFLSMREKEE